MNWQQIKAEAHRSRIIMKSTLNFFTTALMAFMIVGFTSCEVDNDIDGSSMPEQYETLEEADSISIQSKLNGWSLQCSYDGVDIFINGNTVAYVYDLVGPMGGPNISFDSSDDALATANDLCMENEICEEDTQCRRIKWKQLMDRIVNNEI